MQVLEFWTVVCEYATGISERACLTDDTVKTQVGGIWLVTAYALGLCDEMTRSACLVCAAALYTPCDISYMQNVTDTAEELQGTAHVSSNRARPSVRCAISSRGEEY